MGDKLNLVGELDKMSLVIIIGEIQVENWVMKWKTKLYVQKGMMCSNECNNYIRKDGRMKYEFKLVLIEEFERYELWIKSMIDKILIKEILSRELF